VSCADDPDELDVEPELEWVSEPLGTSLPEPITALVADVGPEVEVW